MKLFISALFFFLFSSNLFAQLSLTGSVASKDGEVLVGATVQLNGSFTVVLSDAKGFFKFNNLKPGKYSIVVSYIGLLKSEINFVLDKDLQQNVVLQKSEIISDEVIISATRAGIKTPIAYSTIGKEELQKQNLGQDVPFLLNLQPSVVVTSDAGTGVGYTSMRIRGTDQSRINVTINGIPLNDPESHGVYWVDLPDFASSVENIQIQRGVGTSTNGAGAFGGSINLKTAAINKDAYVNYESSAGSFGTFKNAVRIGSGLLSNGITSDFRYSRVKSDGFIDRASANLESLYGSIAYYKAKGMMRLNVFSGHERTYQAWYGIPKIKLQNDKSAIAKYIETNELDAQDAANLNNSGLRTFNQCTYKNEVDDYTQQHYQFLYSYQFNSNFSFDGALHYTKGFGYYENYKKNKKLTSFGMPDLVIDNLTIKKTDLIRRKFLDNDFFGSIFSLNYKSNNIDLTVGAAGNKYVGDHFGRVIWAQYSSVKDNDFEYYFNKGTKLDYNLFSKLTIDLHPKFSAYLDLQYRRIDFNIKGTDDAITLDIAQKFDFFNPKFGLFYNSGNGSTAYSSISIANREPNRNNYTDEVGIRVPTNERLLDLEIGYNFTKEWFILGVNLYNMNYKNQLISTGELNDVGDPIMLNVPESYRRGIELTGALKYQDFRWNTNFTISQNKILNFEEFVPSLDENWAPIAPLRNQLGTTDIAMSPEKIFCSDLNYSKNGLSVSIISKYIDKQFIDNSSSNERVLDSYWLNNLLINYTFKPKFIHEIGFNFMLNNLFNKEYISNAWTSRSYVGKDELVYDGYFPQAGRNFMFGVVVKF